MEMPSILNDPFLKLTQNVLNIIKGEPLESKPKRVYLKLIEESGGPLYSSASTEPINVNKFYNVRMTQKHSNKDDFTHFNPGKRKCFCA
jgi:hypothetical protein